MIYSLIRQFLRCLFDERTSRKRLIFHEIKIDNVIVQGDIKMVKLEFDQFVEFNAVPVDRRGKLAKIEPGSAQWTVTAVDMDGNDASEFVDLVQDPDNELKVRLTSSDIELTGVVTLRADGDADAGEEAFIVATADIIVDAPNVMAFSLQASEPADVVEEAPVEEPVEEEPVEEEPVEEPVEEIPEEEPVEETPVEAPEEQPLEPADETEPTFPEGEDQAEGDEQNV